MLNDLILTFIKYSLLIVVFVVSVVLITIQMNLRTREFSWNKRTVRIFAILYDLDRRGRICFSIMLVRMIFVIFIAATGGTTGISEFIAIEIATLVYAIISGDKKSFLQLLVYIVIYILIVMESLFMSYYTDVDNDLLVLFCVIAFGVFASLYTIHQTITGYERLITVCAERDREKYDKHSETIERYKSEESAELGLG